MKLFLFASLLFIFQATAYGDDVIHPTSIIFVIGDGMGPAYTTAYRLYADNPDTPELEATLFVQLASGFATTYSAPQIPLNQQEQPVTDSAAAATALATGTKTINGFVGIDADKNELTTTLEQAKLQGYRTGMVVTSTITHATPASFVAHHHDRNNESLIARQYLQKNSRGEFKFDLLMGGGRDYFLQHNLIDQLVKEGFHSVTDYNQLNTLTHLPLIALFEQNAFSYAINSEGSYRFRLRNMTQKALQLLQGKPFFLMVEGSQIDWCGHDNDIACVMAEMHDFALTIELLKHYVDNHPDTLLVITADHETGGLTLGNKSAGTQWNPNVIKQINGSTTAIQNTLFLHKANWQQAWQEKTGITLDNTRQHCHHHFENTVNTFLTDAQCVQFLLDGPCNVTTKSCGLDQQINNMINRYSHTSWQTTHHTSAEVQIFSYGKYQELFSGHMDNTDIAKNLFEVLAK